MLYLIEEIFFLLLHFVGVYCESVWRSGIFGYQNAFLTMILCLPDTSLITCVHIRLWFQNILGRGLLLLVLSQYFAHNQMSFGKYIIFLLAVNIVDVTKLVVCM